MQHRELLKPGPKAAKLRMKASPYQELACGSSKRKANSSAVGSSSDTTQEGVQASTKLGEVKPIKALKVIHHRFSNGEPGDEQFKGCHCRAISEEAGTIKEGLQNGGKNGSVRATPNHLMYKDTRSGRWRTTDRQPRQYNYHLGSDGGKQLSGRVLRPRTNPKYCPDEQAPDSTSDDETVTYVKNEDKHGSDKGLGSGHLCTGLACAYPGCYARPDFRSITPTSLSHDNQKKDFEANSFCGRSSSSGCHYLSNSEPAKNQHGSISPRAAIDLATKALQSHPNPPLSMREMAANLHPEVHYCSKDLKIEDDQAANVLASVSLKVSPIANGQVWESRATREARARQELELALAWNNPSYPSFTSTTDTSLSAYNDLPLDGTSSTPTNDLPKPFTPTSNTFAGPTTAGPTPPRYQNQDPNCLVCLQPVTPSDLLVSDLRCVACPRTFHESCLNYSPPRINQNWRCSLCYRETWHGYGHLPAEGDVNNPSLVERYRRRLLLAKTYADPTTTTSTTMATGSRREGEGDVRFWFEVDLDGGAESDQAVLVRMGLANQWSLRLLSTDGDGEGWRGGKSVEELERWGVALGMALQEEERRGGESRAEVERLKQVVEEKDREIRELEGGL